MPYDQAGRTPSITVVHSKTTTVLEMEHPVIDFITLCESPYTSGKAQHYINKLWCLKCCLDRVTGTVCNNSSSTERFSGNGPTDARFSLPREPISYGYT